MHHRDDVARRRWHRGCCLRGLAGIFGSAMRIVGPLGARRTLVRGRVMSWVALFFYEVVMIIPEKWWKVG